MSTKALYVHIPFCDHICGYCDFTRFKYARVISDDFMIRLIQQINALPNNLETIYVGGGTPTSLEDDQLEALLQALKPHLATDYEWTFEGNPENLTYDKVKMLHDYGVNRMSLGVQTSDDDLLEKIGRHHKFYDVGKGVQLLRDIGIDNISLDLMYGLPGQTLESFQKSMKDIIALQPDHVSIYALTVEPNSLFGRRGIKPVPIELETEMFLSCIEIMQANGFEHYEISNFSKPGARSRHNQVYWRYEDFYALGPGSSMKVDHTRRTWTVRLGEYLQKEAYKEVIELSLEDEMFEFIMMGLRIREGITFKRFYDRFGITMQDVFSDAIQQGVHSQLLEVNDDGIVTTFNGYIMLDDVLLPFMDILGE
ncbi:radical SAM family heme chaperone HemW [Erysipelothrix sp. HDW6C]|uniref:radical SAM family heme chaperone HemW n=1 Tax=Erysipelothrix sp. HDW6C TaxID=2714930 RepID=UPI00140E5E88|nr:radical SAM family heme chaperone HemW [Erysipelothrix sp. HDW6C]QIK70441.1 radical SAM family heme chaperone HemW [Erysipelothrix sp. HDW6C]